MNNEEIRRPHKDAETPEEYRCRFEKELRGYQKQSPMWGYRDMLEERVRSNKKSFKASLITASVVIAIAISIRINNGSTPIANIAFALGILISYYCFYCNVASKAASEALGIINFVERLSDSEKAKL
ncbi:MAG: hypothetical protein WCP03_03570 [Candidatus Saccharibacteria bacterium]